VQIALVAFVYLCTYALSFLLVKLIGTMTFLGKNQETLSMMIWGFNFIIGVLLAMAFKGVFARLKKRGVFKREYTNNYMLNRISGLAFDFMIVASIGSIEISGLAESLVPFLIITTLGAVATFWYLRWICFKMYPAYKYEAMLAMYGMLTGTVSTGIVLLREIDPYFKTPASSDMVYGSTVAVVWGVPLLLAVGPAAASAAGLWATFGAVIVYGIALVLFITRFKGRKRAANKGGGAGAVSNNGAGAPSQ
jgi:ESS family glutamate:Na+ symporter